MGTPGEAGRASLFYLDVVRSSKQIQHGEASTAVVDSVTSNATCLDTIDVIDVELG